MFVVSRKRKRIAIVSLVILTFVGGLLAFLFQGQLPAWIGQFAPRRVVAIHIVTDEEIRYSYVYFPDYAVIQAGSDENDRMRRVRHLYDGNELKYGEYAQLFIRVDSFFSQRSHARWRTLYRDGDDVFVVYVSVTETPISLLHREYYRLFTGGIWTHSVPNQTYAFQDIENFPQNVEIYYLENLHRMRWRINRMSDERFDALRADGALVWSGVIGSAE